MTSIHEQHILESWHKNVAPWITAVQQQQIASRRLVTNTAMTTVILQQLASAAPDRPLLLDLGCGEGWLARTLSQQGVQVHGVDGVAGLIEQAQEKGGGCFTVLPYAAIEPDCFTTLFDAIACNFSLFGEQSVIDLLRKMPSLLKPSGKVVIQTLHPMVSCGELPYQSGWREGSWAGFSEEFTDPAPWYFRTLERWVYDFKQAGLMIRDCIEPVYPNSGQPASIIFVLSPYVLSPYAI